MVKFQDHHFVKSPLARQHPQYALRARPTELLGTELRLEVNDALLKRSILPRSTLGTLE